MLSNKTTNRLILISVLLTIALGCSDPNCKSCPTDTNICQSCKNGYYLNGNCRPCKDQIQDCSTCDYNTATGAPECSKCDNTFALNSTSTPQCVDCFPTYPLCSKCAINTNNVSAFVCQGCNSLSLLNKDNLCVLCSTQISNCQYCSQTQIVPNVTIKCVSCFSGFYSSQDNLKCLTCQQSIEDCEECEYQAPFQPPKCSICADGYNQSTDNRLCQKSITTTIIIIVVVAVAVLLVAGALFYLYKRRQAKARESNPLMEQEDAYEKAF